MKIEKINDNQIRCTVTLADLNDRNLKISELITNSAKAKLLLRDMVQQAAAEFGFDVDGMSLMIETAPASKDTVVFTITRMNGEPAPGADHPTQDQMPPSKLIGAESIAHFINQLLSHTGEAQPANESDGSFCIFSFDTLEQVVLCASTFDGCFHVRSSLYKDEHAPCYLLVVSKLDAYEVDYNRACNMITEYAALEENNAASLSYIKEHNRLLIKDHALASLGVIR